MKQPLDLSVNAHLIDELSSSRRKVQLLRQAVVRADTANQAKTLFLGAMAHELRTPLNAILGFSDIIRTQSLGPANPKYADYANDIHEAGQHLLSLMNQLLDISRIEAGQFTLTEEAFDLASCVMSAFQMMQAQAIGKQVALSFEAKPDLPGMYGDPTRVRQILINLVSNAVKFTPSGGSVAITAGEESDGSLRIAVTDTGIGISRQDLSRIFEVFGQVSNAAAARPDEGAGIGLPLAKELTERHGGRLELDSEPGYGTTVTVIFPAHRAITCIAA